MSEQGTLDLPPHEQAMADVDDLARVLYEVRESGGWDHVPWAVRTYWRGVATKAVAAGWRHGTRSPEPGGVLDRDQARKVLDLWSGGRIQYGEGLLDRLAGCVRPAAIDRDALTQTLPDALLGNGVEAVYGSVDWGGVADRILALVRPVADVTLTPEEAALAATALRLYDVRDATVNTLAARLEAAS